MKFPHGLVSSNSTYCSSCIFGPILNTANRSSCHHIDGFRQQRGTAWTIARQLSCRNHGGEGITINRLARGILPVPPRHSEYGWLSHRCSHTADIFVFKSHVLRCPMPMCYRQSGVYSETESSQTLHHDRQAKCCRRYP